jgi:hypothetical protein
MDCADNGGGGDDGGEDVLFHLLESDLIFLWGRLYWSEWFLFYCLY